MFGSSVNQRLGSSEEWTSAELEAMAHTSPADTLEEDLQEAIDGMYHRAVAKLQLWRRQQLHHVLKSSDRGLLVKRKGSLRNGDAKKSADTYTIETVYRQELMELQDAHSMVTIRMLSGIGSPNVSTYRSSL